MVVFKRIIIFCKTCYDILLRIDNIVEDSDNTNDDDIEKDVRAMSEKIMF